MSLAAGALDACKVIAITYVSKTRGSSITTEPFLQGAGEVTQV